MTAGQAPRVGVVIPSYRGGSDLLRALRSIRASQWQPSTVIVVDNASDDGSIPAVEREFPEVTVLINGHNEGFGTACNRGLDLARQRHQELVLLLNQDAILHPEALGSMVELAIRRPQAAVVGCRTLSTTQHADGTPLLLYNGAWRWWLPTLQRIPGIGGSSASADLTPRQVDYVWGHGMLLNCQALESVGQFDPRYFMYYEDLDLCWRLEQAGWELWCDSRAVIQHAMEDGARARQSQLWRWRMKASSSRYFYRKRHRRPWADGQWLLASMVEGYWLVRGGHSRAMAHLLQATWEEIRSSGAP